MAVGWREHQRRKDAESNFKAQRIFREDWFIDCVASVIGFCLRLADGVERGEKNAHV